MIAYLSGAMEHAANEGADWRREMTTWLRQELGHDVIDPVQEAQLLLAREGGPEYRMWKETRPEDFRRIVRKMIDRDLRAVKEECDYLICLWNRDVLYGGGTHGEVTVAYDHGKPVYLINQLPVADLSGWIFSCSQEVFASLSDCQAFLLDRYGPKK